MIYLQDIYNCYMNVCATTDSINDYEEKLLEKCVNNDYDYEKMLEAPPFSIRMY
jgi:hypothetical protein